VYGLVETLAVRGKKVENAATGITVGLSDAGDRSTTCRVSVPAALAEVSLPCPQWTDGSTGASRRLWIDEKIHIQAAVIYHRHR